MGNKIKTQMSNAIIGILMVVIMVGVGVISVNTHKSQNYSVLGKTNVAFDLGADVGRTT